MRQQSDEAVAARAAAAGEGGARRLYREPLRVLEPVKLQPVTGWLLPGGPPELTFTTRAPRCIGCGEVVRFTGHGNREPEGHRYGIACACDGGRVDSLVTGFPLLIGGPYSWWDRLSTGNGWPGELDIPEQPPLETETAGDVVHNVPAGRELGEAGTASEPPATVAQPAATVKPGRACRSISFRAGGR